ncbi:hypothetical protein QBC37DRAFT_401449 [Rhypophila decipiens]|uniref:Uncharacterized protein n=1 Tax=Rhypophila decipiens TaxID=261697 RepID=A0AAN6Y734_9PEZI|nr:hypothetical protein QBC37DRAFT_401449 [Rhypophila decipiens]
MASHSQELSDAKVYGPRANTLVVYNFSPTATLLALVQTIILAGTFGTLYSAQLLGKSPINYPEFNGPCHFLTFTTRKASAHLLAFIRQHGIVHRRAVLQARWATITATKVPETDLIEDEPSPVCSRVLILKGVGPVED